MPRQAYIVSTGAGLPSLRLPNAWFDELLGEPVSAWLEEQAHIFERRWCGPEESTADLCEGAARQALARAGIGPEALDLILVATDTPEYLSPSTAAVVQHRLGAARAGVADLNAACAGFVSALDFGAAWLQARKQARHVLVIGAYAISRFLDRQDKKTLTLFADGAGAVLLAATEEPGRGLLAARLSARGELHGALGIFGGGARQPCSEETLRAKAHLLQFREKLPPSLNENAWREIILGLAEEIGCEPAAVKRFFITQINIRSLRATLESLGLPPERAHTIMQRYAYTGSASIPMALDDAWQQGLLAPGDLIFLVASGGGLSFAGAALRL